MSPCFPSSGHDSLCSLWLSVSYCTVLCCAGSSIHRDEVTNRKGRSSAAPPKSPNVEWQWLPKSPGVDRRPAAKNAPLKPRIAPKPTKISNPSMVCSMPARSITMDVFNRESVAKARQIVARDAMQKSTLRQSLSVESFADLMGEKKKKFRFVRKVATSFRFKKPAEKEPTAADKLLSTAYISSRSLPQSPQVERKQKKPAYLGENTAHALVEYKELLEW